MLAKPASATETSSIVRINAIFSGICKYSTTLAPTFSSFFPGSLLKLTGIFLPQTDFVLATPPYQPNFRAQGESQAATQVSAAERLNGGLPSTNRLAAGLDFRVVQQLPVQG